MFNIFILWKNNTTSVLLALSLYKEFGSILLSLYLEKQINYVMAMYIWTRLE